MGITIEMTKYGIMVTTRDGFSQLITSRPIGRKKGLKKEEREEGDDKGYWDFL
jgi:hypothetical protein